MTENKVATVLTLALEALTARAVVILATVMSFGLFAWAMAESSWICLTIAAVFAILVFLPILWRSNGNSTQ